MSGITRAVEERAPKMVFLTSPNNPDGSVIAEADLLALLALPVLVVLDEAYIVRAFLALYVPQLCTSHHTCLLTDHLSHMRASQASSKPLRPR